MTKKKILMLSDHALSTSGVGCQSRYLINGLLQKGCWTVRQYGAALKHTDLRTQIVNEDFIIKPIEGFGSRELILKCLASERPDVLLLFTDPRFFIYIWQMHDEINKICPIAYWHVWDNGPTPQFNKTLYEGTDLINCLSHLTYEMVNEIIPGKANYIPHALPKELFFKIPDEEIKKQKAAIFGNQKNDHFILFWSNRNARRKRPPDLIEAWSKFLKMINTEGKNNATLLLHTDPLDFEGSDLYAVSNKFQIPPENITFSDQRLEFEKMNILYNVIDCTINISYAEGFGLSTLESMQAGKPIIALKTGGLTRQVVDHRDGSENGIALPVEYRTTVGSTLVPYIYEDHVSTDTIAKAIYDMYTMGDEKRKQLGEKASQYVDFEFNMTDMIDKWNDSLLNLVNTYSKENKFVVEEIVQ